MGRREGHILTNRGSVFPRQLRMQGDESKLNNNDPEHFNDKEKFEPIMTFGGREISQVLIPENKNSLNTRPSLAVTKQMCILACISRYTCKTDCFVSTCHPSFSVSSRLILAYWRSCLGGLIGTLLIPLSVPGTSLMLKHHGRVRHIVIRGPFLYPALAYVPLMTVSANRKVVLVVKALSFQQEDGLERYSECTHWDLLESDLDS